MKGTTKIPSKKRTDARKGFIFFKATIIGKKDTGNQRIGVTHQTVFEIGSKK